MSKHTVGPWEIRHSPHDNSAFIVAPKSIAGEALGRPYPREIMNEDEPEYQENGEREADAHLIAAAPDLLMALEEAVALCRKCDGVGITLVGGSELRPRYHLADF